MKKKSLFSHLDPTCVAASLSSVERKNREKMLTLKSVCGTYGKHLSWFVTLNVGNSCEKLCKMTRTWEGIPERPEVVGAALVSTMSPETLSPDPQARP